MYRKYTRRRKYRHHSGKNKYITIILVIFLISLIIQASGGSAEKNDIKQNAEIIRETFSGQSIITVPKTQLLCDFMVEQLGKKYVYGCAGPDYFDCSGLTQYLYEQIGIALPRVVTEQSYMGTYVDRCDLKFGDIVFFSNDGASLTHDGIYVGNGYFLHAPKTGDIVKLSNLTTGYYSKVYKMSVRVLEHAES